MDCIGDTPYTRESKTDATLHDPEELGTTRDANATRMDFRFIEASHMSRLVGIGMEGSWDVSVTFHPHSRIPLRVLMVEEPARSNLYLSSRSWVRNGYKLVREWKRSRIMSARQHFSPLRIEKKGVVSRTVAYTIRCANSQATSNQTSLTSGLALQVSLSESPMADGNVLRVSGSSTCTTASTEGISHKGQLDLYGGTFCGLADWSLTDEEDSGCGRPFLELPVREEGSHR